jgi:hypothetical protein
MATERPRSVPIAYHLRQAGPTYPWLPLNSTPPVLDDGDGPRRRLPLVGRLYFDKPFPFVIY